MSEAKRLRNEIFGEMEEKIMKKKKKKKRRMRRREVGFLERVGVSWWPERWELGFGLGKGVLGVGWEMGFVISWWFSEI
jgi:uncharacterized membrane protein YfcA